MRSGMIVEKCWFWKSGIGREDTVERFGVAHAGRR
jgi:hypothetical protein